MVSNKLDDKFKQAIDDLVEANLFEDIFLFYINYKHIDPIERFLRDKLLFLAKKNKGDQKKMLVLFKQELSDDFKLDLLDVFADNPIFITKLIVNSYNNKEIVSKGVKLLLDNNSVNLLISLYKLKPSEEFKKAIVNSFKTVEPSILKKLLPLYKSFEPFMKAEYIDALESKNLDRELSSLLSIETDDYFISKISGILSTKRALGTLVVAYIENMDKQISGELFKNMIACLNTSVENKWYDDIGAILTNKFVRSKLKPVVISLFINALKDSPSHLTPLLNDIYFKPDLLPKIFSILADKGYLSSLASVNRKLSEAHENELQKNIAKAIDILSKEGEIVKLLDATRLKSKYLDKNYLISKTCQAIDVLKSKEDYLIITSLLTLKGVPLPVLKKSYEVAKEQKAFRDIYNMLLIRRDLDREFIFNAVSFLADNKQYSLLRILVEKEFDPLAKEYMNLALSSINMEKEQARYYLSKFAREYELNEKKPFPKFKRKLKEQIKKMNKSWKSLF